MEETKVFKNKPREGEPWDVVIVGSGPAALTSAIYTTRGAASTLIIGGSSWGGQLMLTTKVDNFPGFPDGIKGPEIMQKMRKQAEKFGAEFIESDVKSVEFESTPLKLETNGDTYLARSVIIATGADVKWLGVPGEDELRGRGVSSCAPCDAPFFKDKEVVVVGGGDSAMEEALVLTKYSPKVTIIHRRDQFRASKAMQEEVMRNEKISVLWNTEVLEVIGDGTLSAIKLETELKSTMGNSLKEGKIKEFNGEIIEEKDNFLFWKMPVQGLFVAIGHTPSTGVIKNTIKLDAKGYVVKSQEKKDGGKTSISTTETNVKGVFVAGDVHDYTYRQAITAAGFGCMAGMDVLRFLDKDAPNW